MTPSSRRDFLKATGHSVLAAGAVSLAAGTFAVIASDVGGDIADIDVVDAQADMRGLPVLAPVPARKT